MRVTAIGLAVALAACAFGLSERSRRILDGMVGIDAKDLRACIGQPQALDLVAESRELLRYEFAWKNPMTGADIEGLEHGPRLMAGSFEDSDKPPGGSCSFTVALVGGVVETFEVKGRRSDGLNADETCLAAIAHCVPEDTAPEP